MRFGQILLTKSVDCIYFLLQLPWFSNFIQPYRWSEKKVFFTRTKWMHACEGRGTLEMNYIRCFSFYLKYTDLAFNNIIIQVKAAEESYIKVHHVHVHDSTNALARNAITNGLFPFCWVTLACLTFFNPKVKLKVFTLATEVVSFSRVLWRALQTGVITDIAAPLYYGQASLGYKLPMLLALRSCSI